MNILGIESSCDETAAAVVNERMQVVSSVVASQIDLHRVTHGVVPEVAARAHTEKILPVIDECLRRAKLSAKKIDGVAVTYGPGLITSLLVGLETAKALAYGWNVPLIGVNHIEGHMLSNLLVPRGGRRLVFDKKRLPIIILTVSGGHTELYALRDIGNYKLLGRTRDDAAGEAFDKVAKLLGLPYPGGPAISSAAEKGNPGRFSFPRPMMSARGAARFDFSFAGLKSAVAREIEKFEKNRARSGLSQQIIADMAASFEQAVVDTLLAKASLAVTENKAKELWIVGGVAANTRLREQGRGLARSKKISLRIPSFEFCTDNAVMIAAVGVLRLHEGRASRQKKLMQATNGLPKVLRTLEADPNLDLVQVG